MATDPVIVSSLVDQATKLTGPQVRKFFQASFQKIKNRMIVEFLNHPVTLELKQGIGAKNISGTLGGVTNLYSFIGFEEGSDPTQAIEDILQQTNFQYLGPRGRSINFAYDLPSAEEIFSVTPMPWAPGRSWAKGIETGISGLGYYLKVSRDSSRSGLGIQSPRKLRRKGTRFKNTSYISALIKKYRKEFENLQL